MPFKLTKQERAEWDAHTGLLSTLRAELDQKIQEINDEMQERVNALSDQINAYNEHLEVVRGFCEDTVSQAQEDYESKSERWQESERGEAASSWISEWENISLDDIEPPELEPLSIECDHEETLEALPTEMEA